MKHSGGKAAEFSQGSPAPGEGHKCPEVAVAPVSNDSKQQNLVLLFLGHSLSPVAARPLLQKVAKGPYSLLSGTNKYLFMPHYVARSV